jgi:hypothetical protein
LSLIAVPVVGLSLVGGHEKAHQRNSPAGWFASDLSGRLLQAMAIRRHGCAMMVVAVVAEALHLFPT